MLDGIDRKKYMIATYYAEDATSKMYKEKEIYEPNPE